MKRIFAAAKKGSVLELLVYDTIGADWFGEGVTAKGVAAQMKAAGDYSSIRARINSPGGDVFEGVAIGNLLRSSGKPVAVIVDGVAASAASVIAMAGDTISMGQGAMMMIHNAWTITAGDAGSLRKTADTLEKVSASIAETYTTKTGKDAAAMQALMDAETWLSAEDCVREGFATEVAPQSAEDQKQARALAASFHMQFANTPDFGTVEPEETPEPVAAVDWEGDISIRRKRLELAAA